MARHANAVRPCSSVAQRSNADGARLKLEPGQRVVPHGPDRNLTAEEVTPADQQ